MGSGWAGGHRGTTAVQRARPQCTPGGSSLGCSCARFPIPSNKDGAALCLVSVSHLFHSRKLSALLLTLRVKGPRAMSNSARRCTHRSSVRDCSPLLNPSVFPFTLSPLSTSACAPAPPSRAESAQRLWPPPAAAASARRTPAATTLQRNNHRQCTTGVVPCTRLCSRCA